MEKKKKELVLDMESDDINADWIKHVSETSYEDELQVCRDTYEISEEDLPALNLEKSD